MAGIPRRIDENLIPPDDEYYDPEEDPAFWDKVDRDIKERKEEPELYE